ncbi:MAG: disulfide bond formation protein B [Gemmatimonadales bacterium]
MTLSEARLRTVLAWIVIVLATGPVGGAVMLGIVHGDSPCILCWAQRTSMVLIALVGLFVLRYGPRPRYIGTVILLGAWGMFMALRHAALHLARDVGQGFAAPILGVHTYVWSWIIHFVALAAIAALLMLQREEPLAPGVRELSRTGRIAMVLFLIVVAANAVQAFASTGVPPWIGQGDPARFSLNPKHWVRDNEETQGAISLRGSWTISQPDIAALDPDPVHGPFAALPELPVTRWLRVAAPYEGSLSGFARDGATGRLAITTDRFGVLMLDSAADRVLHRVVIDPGFSVDLTPLAGVAFLGGDSLATVGTNKSYVLLMADPRADPEAEWRHFLSSDGGVRELARSRFQTVRARQMYVRSVAFDPVARELITVAVPSPRQRRMVVSRFALGDRLLSSEFEPRVAAPLAPRDSNRSVADYVVMGAAVDGRTLYAISAAYSTLLAINLDTRMLEAAYTIPGLSQPVGIAVQDYGFLIAQRDGRIAVVARLPTHR